MRITPRIHLLAMATLTLFFVHALAARAAAPADGVFNVRGYGAVGDGKTLDTQAIQSAIDACAAAGGGRVVLAGGVFLSGTIELKSHVTLYLESGATLLGSASLADFPHHVPALRSYTDNYTDTSLIWAEKQEDISILGRGTIDGQGGAETYKGKPYMERPYMIRVFECKNVTLRDVTIVNSPMWVQHYLGCEGVLIDGITVHSLVNRNNDGIDIDACERVRIANCDIRSGDDAIVLKSTTGRPCRLVTVTNCVLSSNCNAFKLGTESNGGFQDITFSNSVIHNTRLAGIALELVDGGVFERVNVEGITMTDALGGIFVRLGNRARPFKEGQEKPAMGRMKDIIIRDVQASGIGPTGNSITGIPGHCVENITLENLRLRMTGGGKAASIGREVPEKEDSYPEFKVLGELPAYGLYVRHARNVRIAHVELGFEKDEPRPALVCDDVSDLDLENLKAQILPAAPALAWLKGVSAVRIHGCRYTEKTVPFLKMDAPAEELKTWGNDVPGLK